MNNQMQQVEERVLSNPTDEESVHVDVAGNRHVVPPMSRRTVQWVGVQVSAQWERSEDGTWTGWTRDGDWRQG